MKVNLTYSVNDIPDIGTTIRSPFRNFQRGRGEERKHRCGHAPKQKSHLSLSLFGYYRPIIFLERREKLSMNFRGIRIVRGRWKRENPGVALAEGTKHVVARVMYTSSSSPKSPRGVRDTARNAGLASDNWRRSCFNQLVAEWG